jgi:hypothetical protein
MDHREIAVRVPVMNEMQFLFPSEPCKSLKPRSLYVVFLVEKDVRVSADPAVLTGHMGKNDVMDDVLASFAMAYARRTQSDYDRLVKSKRPATKRR